LVKTIRRGGVASVCACTYHTFYFGIHPAREHIPHHFVIGYERPEWIFERRGFIFFDNEMGEPRERITSNKAQRDEIPAGGRNEEYEEQYAERGSGKVQQSRRGLRMLADVKFPEVGICFNYRLILGDGLPSTSI